jgi:trans-2-enoyl-CoA reductase|tara:strand:- start:3847 stop:4125 length:279 start_codon:yes stop_codon:yes gene_type:complete
MSDSTIKNNYTQVQYIQKMNTESVKKYHQKLDDANRVRLNDNLLIHNKQKSEMNELMLKLYHERIDRLLTYNQYANIVKPLMDQGKIISIEA